jgi:hypothetical protein
MLLRKGTLITDHLVALERVNPMSADGAWQLFLHTLRDALLQGCGAIHLFYHEADDVVRQVLWNAESCPGVWAEAVPMGANAGRNVLEQLRRLTRLCGRPRGGVGARLRLVIQGSVRPVELFSPHGWDVRLYLTEQRPSILPYELVLAGHTPAPSPPTR